MQVASKFAPVGTKIVGIDLVPIRPIPNCVGIVGDITTQKARNDIKKELNGTLVDSCIHDGAPNVGKAWLQDAYSQSELVLLSLKLAVEFLRPGGTFVTKIFRSRDYNCLLWVFNQLFKTVEATKPSASRNSSAEIFVVCLGFLAPKKIDPKLLDPRAVFSEIQEEAKKPDFIHLSQVHKKVRQREGYADNATTLHATCSASDFINSSEPILTLAKYNAISFPSASEGASVTDLYIDSHPTTTDAIRAYCKDLKVLGKGELKAMLKWRAKFIKERESEKNAQKAEEEAARLAALDPAQVAAQQEMDIDEEIRNKEKDAIRKRLKDRRKALFKRKRELLRIHLQMGGDQHVFEETGDASLFKLEDIKSIATIDRLLAAEDPSQLVNLTELGLGEEDAYAGSSDSEVEAGLSDTEAYERKLEAGLDRMYDEYVEKRKKREASLKSKLKQNEVMEFLANVDDDSATTKQALYIPDLNKDPFEEQHPEIVKMALKKKRAREEAEAAELSSNAENSDNDDREGSESEESGSENPLLVGGLSQTRRSQVSRAAHMFYGSSIFAKFQDDEEDEDEDFIRKLRDQINPAKSAEAEGPVQKGIEWVDEAGVGHVESDHENEKFSKDTKHLKRESKSEKSEKKKIVTEEERAEPITEMTSEEKSAAAIAEGKRRIEEELLAADLASSSESEAEQTEEQIQERKKGLTAEGFALAKLMMNKKRRREIIDDSYNRYAFADRDTAPAWFREDEERHSRPQAPVTREQIYFEKQRLKDIDARPIKKVAEARERKRRRLANKMERANKQAGKILNADDQEMSTRDKQRTIEKLYAKTGGKASMRKVTVVSRRPGAGSNSKKYKLVDTRLRKDLRSQRAADKRKGIKAPPKRKEDDKKKRRR